MSCREIQPWKKPFRGAKRYYAALDRRAAAFSFDLGANSWFDLHHTHFDWVGHGRRSMGHRRQHLAALFIAFRRVLEEVRSSGRPLQLWVSIAPDTEPEQDALYIHSPNPNGTPFPDPFEGTVWNVSVPPLLRELVSEPSWEVGRREFDGIRWHVIREKTP